MLNPDGNCSILREIHILETSLGHVYSSISMSGAIDDETRKSCEHCLGRLSNLHAFIHDHPTLGTTAVADFLSHTAVKMMPLSPDGDDRDNSLLGLRSLSCPSEVLDDMHLSSAKTSVKLNKYADAVEELTQHDERQRASLDHRRAEIDTIKLQIKDDDQKLIRAKRECVKNQARITTVSVSIAKVKKQRERLTERLQETRAKKEELEAELAELAWIGVVETTTPAIPRGDAVNELQVRRAMLLETVARIESAIEKAKKVRDEKQRSLTQLSTQIGFVRRDVTRAEKAVSELGKCRGLNRLLTEKLGVVMQEIRALNQFGGKQRAVMKMGVLGMLIPELQRENRELEKVLEKVTLDLLELEAQPDAEVVESVEGRVNESAVRVASAKGKRLMGNKEKAIRAEIVMLAEEARKNERVTAEVREEVKELHALVHELENP